MNQTKSATPIDRHVGAKVRERRQILGWSQTKLGDALGVTFQQVQKYEKGRNRIGASRLLQIASILKTDVSFFFDGASQPKTKGSDGKNLAYITEFAASEDGRALARAFSAIQSDKLRRGLIRMVEQIAQG